MKKLSLFLFTSLSIFLCKAQYSSSDQMQVLNYSKYELGGHVSARADNCFPALRGEFSALIYPFNDPLGRNTAVYQKYINSHLQPIPINTWLVATTATSYLTIPANSAAPNGFLTPFLVSPYGNNTRWGGIQVEYWDPNSTIQGGFSLNYDVRIESMSGGGSPNVCLSYPMIYSVPNEITASSFYTGGSNNDYIVIIM